MSSSYDVVVVGAGIVGLATGIGLQNSFPGLRVAIVEKEDRIAAHQTGHNSGVIHSGLYYRPGSMKAGLCLGGYDMLVRFCREHGIRHEICGKVVVAIRDEELPALEELHRRGQANGVPGLRLLDPSEVKELEPHVTCIRGMHVPSTGIVDYREVAQGYAEVFKGRGGALLLGRKVTRVVPDGASSLRISCDCGTLSGGVLINCGGLYSDRVAESSGMTPPCRIVPFRGEYYQIRPERGSLIRNLVYPVPDPRFPFLGVHFTRMIDGKVEAGPNAVLAFAREGYRRTSFAPMELLDTLRYDGFRRLARRYWRSGLGEMGRSCSKALFTRALRRLVPELCRGDLSPGGAGVRAQALGHDGKLLDDFVVMRTENMVHVLNAPSPAATSSLAIGAHVAGLAADLMRR